MLGRRRSCCGAGAPGIRGLETWHISRSPRTGMFTSTPQGPFQSKCLSGWKTHFNMFSRLLGKSNSVEISLRKLGSCLNSLRKATISGSSGLHQILRITLLSRVSDKSWGSLVTWFQMLGVVSILQLVHYLGLSWVRSFPPTCPSHTGLSPIYSAACIVQKLSH